MARLPSKTKVTTLLQPYLLVGTWVEETNDDWEVWLYQFKLRCWHRYELNVLLCLVQCEIPLLYIIFYHKRTQP